MARMSIDDSFGRDARVRRLAKLCGWSRREAMGTLLDIFSLCYDRVNEFLPEADIITTAEQDGLDCPGFVEKMVQVGLAKRHKADMVRIAGAEERLRYLRRQSALGRTGGLMSAERRKKTPKGMSRVRQGSDEACASQTLEGSVNPPDPVPDPSPDLVPDPALAPDLVPDPALAPDPVPDPAHPPRLALVPDPSGPNPEIGRLIRAIFPLQVEAFNRLRSELGLTNIPTMHIIGDASERALQELLRKLPTLEGFEEKARHALAVREREARTKRTLKFLGTALWNEIAFGRAQSMSPSDADAPARGTGTIGPATPRHDHPESREPVDFGDMLK